jgi:hypothetical protein
MALTCTHSNHYKYQLAVGALNLLTDSVKVLLMRSGFVFNKDDHAKKINIINTKTATTLAISAGLALTDSDSGFVTAGFVPGMQVAISGFTEGGNAATKIISTVVAGTIVFTDTSGLVAEIAGDSVTVAGNDELAELYGYLRNTKVLAGQALAEDDSNDRSELTADNVIWTASGGSIGPTPGAILYSDTSADDTIIGYIDFGGEQTAPNGAQFTISNEKIRIS